MWEPWQDYILFKLVLHGFENLELDAVLAVCLCVHDMQFHIWASSWDYGTYHIGDQWKLRQACASVHSPLPSLFAYKKYGSRRRVWLKFRHLAPLDSCACHLKMSLRRMKSAIISTWHILLLFPLVPEVSCDFLLWHSLKNFSFFSSVAQTDHGQLQVY